MGVVRSREDSDRLKRDKEIYGIILIASALLVSLFVIRPSGLIGQPLASFLQFSMGFGRYLAPVFFLIGGAFYLIPDLRKNSDTKIWGLLIIFVSTISLAHLVALQVNDLPVSDSFRKELYVVWGGIVGASISFALATLVKSGAYVILGSSFLIGIILATGFSLAGALELVRARFRSREAGDVQVDETGGSESDVEVVTEEPKAVYETQTLDDLPAAREKEAEAIISESRTVAGAYQRPPLKLLIKSPQSHDLSSKKGVKESVGILKRTLQHFEVAADVKRVVQGPTVTRFEVELSPGVKVNRILNLADDIALALASPDVRILAPIPGKSAVGIEVPNKYRQMVTLGDILRSKQSREATKPLTFGLGKDIGNQPVLASMTDMPHLLIAGATGAGKSVCINSIITSILVKADPADVKMILVDPKRVEFNTYNDIPHLLTPVVTDPKKASVVLAWAVEEMERRYKILAKNKARNIAAYEELASKGEEGEFEKIPFILIIIDELADLMMVSASDVEDGISRLAQMARAVGIHLIVATQRPSADIITGIIRSNITSRIAFTVSSQTDSRVIMDMGGAERLVGKGDMLFLSSGALRPKRVQGSFLTEQEISHVTEFIKKQAKPEYDMDILEKGAKGLSLAVTEDDLLDDAMDLVVNAGYASVSLIQRRLRVGYTRAARLIDIMEDKGIVGGYEGSKPREVLIDADQLQRIRESDLDEQGTVQH